MSENASSSTSSTSGASVIPTGSVLAQWGDWFRLVYLRRRLVAVVVLLVLSSAVWSIVVAERGYDASVIIYIAPVPPNVVQYQQVVDSDVRPYREDFWYGTQYALLLSQPLLRRVADRLDLWDDPVFLPERLRPRRTLLAWISSSLEALTERFRSEPASLSPADLSSVLVEDFDRPPLEPQQLRVLNRLVAALEVTPVPETRLVRILARAPSPQLAHDIGLALANEYIDYDIEHRTSAAREAVGWIADQIDQQKNEVAIAESAVVAYRTDHPDVPLGNDTFVADQGLVELQEDLNVVPLGATSPWETVGEQLCELDQLDASVRTPDDVTAFFALETFAMLPFVEGIGSSAPGADQAPVFQTLRTRLLTLGVGRVAKPAPEADGSISD